MPPGRVSLLTVLGDETTARDIFGPMIAHPSVKAEITERAWWPTYGWYMTPPTPAHSFWDRSLYADHYSLYADHYLTADALSAAVDVIRRFPSEAGPDRSGSMTILCWVGGSVNDVAADDTAYVHRSARLILELASRWATPTDPATRNEIPPDIHDWEESLWETPMPHSNGQAYQNFPDPELPNWTSA